MASVLRQIIRTSKAALPQAPYNQAVRVNDLVFLSGVVGIDRSTNKMVSSDLQAETRQALTNMKFILEAADSGFDKLVKTTIMLNDINDFSTVNEIYKEFVKQEYPARSTFQIGKLPVGARVEIEAIGLCGAVRTEVINI